MKIRFNLGWILAIAAAIVLAAMGFMAFYYRTGGSLVLPVIVAVCLLVLPIVIMGFLTPAKECSRPFYFHKEAVKEITLLAVFVVFFIVSMPLVNHFFTVNSRTDKIAGVIADQRKQLDDMKQSYGKHIDDRLSNYRVYVVEIMENKNNNLDEYNKLFPAGENDTGIFFAELREAISLEGLNDSAANIYGKENLRWWKLPIIMGNVEGISTSLESNYNKMVQRDHNPAALDSIGENDYWSYEYTKAEEIMSYFTKSNGLITSFWTVLCVLIAYLLIALPYIAAERDSRSKGLFAELANSNNNNDNRMGTENIGRL